MAVDTIIESGIGSSVPSFLVPGAASQAIIDMVEKVRPSVVQVQNRGRGIGAGIIWRSSGAILTNFHVVAGGRGQGPEIALSDGRRFDAKIVNYNEALDLALLQVEADDLPAAPVADASKLRVGELLFAVGHPWGQKYFVTAGIVSAVGSVPVPHTGREAQYIRSDVSLAPGNSGGPMLNAQGAVVGISAMIFGGDLGVGIPSHVAAEWVAGLPSRRVYLGVGLQPVRLPAYAGKEDGLMVVAIEPGGPAHRAGLLVGDVLLAAADEPLNGPDQLASALGRAEKNIRLRLLRGNSTRDVDVDLGTQETVS